MAWLVVASLLVGQGSGGGAALQGADQDDTTTVDITLSEAGMAVAEPIGREAEQRPQDKPKVNVNVIEEVVADKGSIAARCWSG